MRSLDKGQMNRRLSDKLKSGQVCYEVRWREFGRFPTPSRVNEDLLLNGGANTTLSDRRGFFLG